MPGGCPADVRKATDDVKGKGPSVSPAGGPFHEHAPGNARSQTPCGDPSIVRTVDRASASPGGRQARAQSQAGAARAATAARPSRGTDRPRPAGAPPGAELSGEPGDISLRCRSSTSLGDVREVPAPDGRAVHGRPDR